VKPYPGFAVLYPAASIRSTSSSGLGGGTVTPGIPNYDRHRSRVYRRDWNGRGGADGQMMESSLCPDARADQQDVVVAVGGRHDLRRGRAEPAASVDVL
jgi:hypothetical protein